MLEPAARLHKVTGHRVLAKARVQWERDRLVPTHLGMIWVLGPGTEEWVLPKKPET